MELKDIKPMDIVVTKNGRWLMAFLDPKRPKEIVFIGRASQTPGKWFDSDLTCAVGAGLTIIQVRRPQWNCDLSFSNWDGVDVIWQREDADVKEKINEVSVLTRFMGALASSELDE